MSVTAELPALGSADDARRAQALSMGGLRRFARVVEEVHEVAHECVVLLGIQPARGDRLELHELLHRSAALAPDGDGYRLDGRKYFTTGTLYADLTEVTAGLPDGSTALAVIPTDRAGVTVVDDWDGMGQRLTGTGTATFAGVRVAREEVLVLPGTEGGASGPPMSTRYRFVSRRTPCDTSSADRTQRKSASMRPPVPGTSSRRKSGDAIAVRPRITKRRMGAPR